MPFGTALCGLNRRSSGKGEKVAVIRIIDNEHLSLPGWCTGYATRSATAADGFAWTTRAFKTLAGQRGHQVTDAQRRAGAPAALTG
jgi:hypothetical protein